MSGREKRWERGFRELGAAMLACSPWLDDPHLNAALDQLSALNIIMRKQPPEWNLRKLHALNERLHGVPVRAMPGFGGMAPKVDGKPMIVGPYTRFDEELTLPAIRALGFRHPEGAAVPIAHAKLAVIGRMWWHDEGPLGHVDDVLGFRPTRLWASWANFTTNSRRCLEFGYWTEEPALVEGAHDFLVRMLRSSEDLQAAHDEPNPDLALVEYDDEAMAEALAEMSWDDDEEKL